MRIKFYYILVFLILHLGSYAQVKETPTLKIFKTKEKIKLDGILDEHTWSKTNKANNFVQQFPFDTSLAASKTEVMITYDDDFIYIAAKCFDETPGDYVIQSLKRDFDYMKNDAFGVYIDPFNDLTNGFCFSVNPLNVQREGSIQYGGGMGINNSWDNTWYSEVAKEKDAWTLEMAIPFKTLRFNEKNKTWRINFSRNDLKRNESSSWVSIPRNFSISSLAFTAEMHWDDNPPVNGNNVSVIPYGITTLNSDYINDTTFIKPNIGIDAKIAVTSSLNLDLTVNPDFAQVEVDRQVTNLSRFSLFFPERRNFFIENSDLFERFGFRQIRPFFSRQIGLNNGSSVPIIGGLRLSGKINQKWRIGLMNMHTRSVESKELDAQNYTVAAAYYQLKGRSNVAAILVNRQGFEKYDWKSYDYNRVVGLDWNIASMDNRISGKLFYHHSFSSNSNDDNFTHASWLMYETPKLTLMWNHEYVGKNYLAEVGFVPRVENYNPITDMILRKSYWRWEPMITYKFYPNKSRVNNHGPRLYLSEYWDGQYKMTERNATLSYVISFNNTAKFTIGSDYYHVKLFFDQDITFSNNSFTAEGFYKYNNFFSEFQSDQRQKFNLFVGARYGGYFNGEKLTASVDLNYRRQPWGIFALSFQTNYIEMPNGFNDVVFHLIGPKVELSFTKSLFFTTFIQYNTQIENVNINSRLQWRFKPMSDLYIVYTENYTSYNIGIKNRALAVKLVWWINL
jgi:hypothetical protein